MKPKYFSIAMYPTVSFKQEDTGASFDVFESNEKICSYSLG